MVLNLISMDKSSFDIEQLFGFMNNSGAKLAHGFFSLKGKSNKEIFRVANALNPGTFEENTKTFAVIMATDLNNVEEPLLAVREMVAFAYNFSEKFYANICDGERLPITKQMISHIETKAQTVSCEPLRSEASSSSLRASRETCPLPLSCARSAWRPCSTPTR